MNKFKAYATNPNPKLQPEQPKPVNSTIKKGVWYNSFNPSNGLQGLCMKVFSSKPPKMELTSSVDPFDINPYPLRTSRYEGFHYFPTKLIDGTNVKHIGELCKGAKVTLVVNVASE